MKKTFEYVKFQQSSRLKPWWDCHNSWPYQRSNIIFACSQEERPNYYFAEFFVLFCLQHSFKTSALAILSKLRFLRIKICVWHWLLLTLETTLINLHRRFHQATSAFIGFFFKPTEWPLSNGSKFCACYLSKNITNDCCAWLREGFVKIRYVYVYCVVVSRRISGPEHKF